MALTLPKYSMGIGDRFAPESPNSAAFRAHVAQFRALAREARLTGAIEKAL